MDHTSVKIYDDDVQQVGDVVLVDGVDSNDEGGGGGEDLEQGVGEDGDEGVGVPHGVDEGDEGGAGVRQPRVGLGVEQDLLLRQNGGEKR